MNNPWLKKKVHEVFLMFVDRPLEMTKRQYPKAVIKREIKFLRGCLDNRGLMGHLDHQQDSVIHLSQASHLITNLKLYEKALWADIEIMNTPNGRILEMLMKEHPGEVVFATCGVGNGQVNEDGVLVVGDNYKLITVNAVPQDGSGKFKTYLRDYLIQE